MTDEADPSLQYSWNGEIVVQRKDALKRLLERTEPGLSSTEIARRLNIGYQGTGVRFSRRWVAKPRSQLGS
ncbi:MAG TPA: hypothetical protein VEW42_05985 [Candidatus Eisenbacteria bacterium]|nr:hypothetical protein [Candidatus Eisenbacteria bacterium]